MTKNNEKGDLKTGAQRQWTMKEMHLLQSYLDLGIKTSVIAKKLSRTPKSIYRTIERYSLAK